MMFFSKQKISIQFFLILWLATKQTLSSPTNTSGSLIYRSVCKSTPYPDVCLESLKLTIGIGININVNIDILLQSLNVAISEGVKLLDLLSNINTSQRNIIEKQKGTIQDCTELQQITISSLNKSLTRLTSSSHNLEDVRAFLAAAVTNKNTCLEGLESASGPLKPLLVDTVITSYKHVINSLSLAASGSTQKIDTATTQDTHLPKWLSRNKNFHISDDDDENTITVAADGSGNFITITDAINFAPDNSIDRVIIYIKQGLYEEYVEIPSYKTNIVLLGDGKDLTIISGKRNMVDGWTTFRSATVAVSGEGFLARDIGFYNMAGAEKQQAVALCINADFAAVYRCVISGYQDTLYVHSFRQFYRECDIYGTIDYIFGNAAVVFQGCNIMSRLPMPSQFTVIAAQSRDSPDEQTGISFQNCSILATEDLHGSSMKSYLGRPWMAYSRTVFIESYIDDLIDPKGWIPWPGEQGLDTLYCGEYGNIGPGSSVDDRVQWPGHHVMDISEASKFTVSEFITGQESG